MCSAGTCFAPSPTASVWWSCTPTRRHSRLAVSERPVASPWARLQAETANTTEGLTNLRHERVEVGGLARFLLRQLDGSHDHAALVESARRPVSEGSLTMHKDGAAVPPDEALNTLESQVEETLGQLARFALLTA